MIHSMLLAAIAVLGVQPAAVQSDGPSDEEAIRTTVDSYVAAYNAGDALAMAAHWSEDGVYLSRSTGDQLSGREAIQADFATALSDNPGLHLDVHIDSLRFITADVAIVDGTATVTLAGEPPSESTYTSVHVRKDNRWLIDSVRETTLPTPPSDYDHLKDLEWLVGDWAHEGETPDGQKLEIRMSITWGHNRDYLKRDFTAKVDGSVATAGMQVIGYDAAQKTIKSWYFAGGGHGEAIWQRDGEGWTLAGTIIDREGNQSEETITLNSIGNDQFTAMVTTPAEGEETAEPSQLSFTRVPGLSVASQGNP